MLIPNISQNKPRSKNNRGFIPLTNSNTNLKQATPRIPPLSPVSARTLLLPRRSPPLRSSHTSHSSPCAAPSRCATPFAQLCRAAFLLHAAPSAPETLIGYLDVAVLIIFVHYSV
ncbi:hypothetical protein S83_034846 [Arachis hypogaea]